MSDSFNGYYVWLGIPPSEQPPNHYRLLGITPLETDLDVIDHAADRQMAHVRTFQSGRNAALSQQILNELAAARVCLLNPERKREYDEQLRAKIAKPVSAVPVGKAVPVAQPVAASVATPRTAPTPTAKPAEIDDPIELETPATAPLADPVADDEDDDLLGASPASVTPAIDIRVPPKRLVNRDASLQRALVYIFVGVAVMIVVLVLYGLVQSMTAGTDWKSWFSVPALEAPLEPGDASDFEPPPEAPTPAPPGSKAD